MSYLPDITAEERLGAAEVARVLALAYHSAHDSDLPEVRDRVTYLGVLAYERLRPLLDHTLPGNLISLAAKNAIVENFLWAARNADEAAECLTTNRATRGATTDE